MRIHEWQREEKNWRRGRAFSAVSPRWRGPGFFIVLSWCGGHTEGSMRILLVEDEPKLAAALARGLLHQRYAVDTPARAQTSADGRDPRVTNRLAWRRTDGDSNSIGGTEVTRCPGG